MVKRLDNGKNSLLWIKCRKEIWRQQNVIEYVKVIYYEEMKLISEKIV